MRTHDSKPFLLTKGPLILALESVFWHWHRYPKRRVAPARPPLHEPASPRELEDPFRIGHGHAFRFPLTRRGFVVGYWEPEGEPVLAEEASGKLMEAVQGAHIPGITATEIKDWARARNYSWLELLVRRYQWLRRLYDRFGPTVTFPVYERANEAVAPIEEEDPRTRPWVDAPIIDMEQARVRGQGSDATFQSAVGDPTFFPQDQEGRAALYPEDHPMHRFHKEGW